jgi:hypothetical protein
MVYSLWATRGIDIGGDARRSGEQPSLPGPLGEPSIWKSLHAGVVRVESIVSKT